jgi:Na+-driven multidrug efflux pump
MIILIIVGVLHIFWCWLFIDCFILGVRGLAIASLVTVLTNYALQTIYLFIVVKRNPKLSEAVGLPDRSSFKIEGLRRFMEIGLPTLI